MIDSPHVHVRARKSSPRIAAALCHTLTHHVRAIARWAQHGCCVLDVPSLHFLRTTPHPAQQLPPNGHLPYPCTSHTTLHDACEPPRHGVAPPPLACHCDLAECSTPQYSMISTV
eukprot:365666-Chlamydomonas_euryale.AAC.10